MTAQTLSIISVVCFGIAAAAAIATVLIWFLLDIKTTIGDLSGKTARRSIELMRQNNSKTSTKSHNPSDTNVKRGPITGKISETAGKKESSEKKEPARNNYAAKENRETKKESVSRDSMPETGILETNNASFLAEATVPLEGTEETTMLKDVPEMPKQRNTANGLKMLEEVILIHTDEVI